MSAKAKAKAAAPATALLPYGRACIEADDVAAVTEVLTSDWLTTGPMVGRFETALADAVNAPHAVVVSSGTAALHLAAKALGIGPGDQVIVPAITFAATANAARFVGADIVFADVDPLTGLMGPKEFEEALTRAPRARAVFPVHFAGQCVPIMEIAAIARARGLAVVEDACHALGSRMVRDTRHLRVGDCAESDFTVFSFHPVKTVAMGEGGALTTRDETMAARLRRLRSHGITREPGTFVESALGFDSEGLPNPWYMEMQELGFNYRANDIQCALGASQLKKLQRFAKTRRDLVAVYDQALRPLAPVVRPMPRLPGQEPCWHIYVALIDFEGLGVERGAVMRALAASGVGSQVHYVPLPLHPYYRALPSSAGSFPGAMAHYARCLSLPLYVGLTPADVRRVVDALADALKL